MENYSGMDEKSSAKSAILIFTLSKDKETFRSRAP